MKKDPSIYARSAYRALYDTFRQIEIPTNKYLRSHDQRSFGVFANVFCRFLRIYPAPFS